MQDHIKKPLTTLPCQSHSSLWCQWEWTWKSYMQRRISIWTGIHSSCFAVILCVVLNTFAKRNLFVYFKDRSLLERQPPLTFLFRGKSVWLQVRENNFIRTEGLRGTAILLWCITLRAEILSPAESVPEKVIGRGTIMLSYFKDSSGK